LNDDNKKLNEQVNELMPLKDEVNELKETVKKQETEIQRLLGNQRDDKDTNKQDNAAVSIAEGGFQFPQQNVIIYWFKLILIESI